MRLDELSAGCIATCHRVTSTLDTTSVVCTERDTEVAFWRGRPESIASDVQ